MYDQYLMSKTELKLTLSCWTLSREQFGEIQMTRDFQIQKNKTKKQTVVQIRDSETIYQGQVVYKLVNN